MCSICGQKKELHIKVLIRANGLGSKVVETKLKCPNRISYYKEADKQE